SISSLFLYSYPLNRGTLSLSTRENSNSPAWCRGMVFIIAVLSSDFNSFFVNICGKCRNLSLSAPQLPHFPSVQGAPSPQGQVSVQGNRTHGEAFEVGHRLPPGCQHPFDLVVFSLLQGDQPLAGRVQHGEFRRQAYRSIP